MFDFFKALVGGGVDEKVKNALDKGGVILDVRTPSEFAYGHVKGSVNIPLDEVSARINQIRKMKQPIVTCCRSGMRSGTAASILQQNGIEAYNGGPWQSVQELL